MGEIIKFKDDALSFIEIAEAFLEDIKNDRITHGVIAYRTKDDDVHYRLLNCEHVTYLMGMLERVKQDMHFSDRFYEGAELI